MSLKVKSATVKVHVMVKLALCLGHVCAEVSSLQHGKVSQVHVALQVSAVVTCEAAGPWGLISTIESIMATQAEKSVAGFLDFCIARCKGEPLPEYGSDTEYLEEFLDAAETLSIASSADLGGGMFPAFRECLVKFSRL